MMHQIIVWTEYILIAALFFECWIALRKWSSKLHSYLFLSCASNLVYNVGVLMELGAKDEQSYVVALKMGYLGRMWIGLAFFLLIMELCKIRVPAVVTAVLAGVHAFIYALIINIENNTLYYDYKEFVIQDGFPRLLHTGGPFYPVQTIMILGYILVGLIALILTYMREKNPIARKRVMMMFMAVITIGLSYVIYVFKFVPLANVFDTTVFGFAVGTFFMIVAILRYRMLDTETLARNYVVDELSEGIIVLNEEGSVTYCNNPALRLFPDLAKQSLTGREAANVIERIRFALYCDEPIKINGRVYTPKANSLIQNGESVGTLYVLMDDTEHYRYMDDLREQKEIADEANKAKSRFLANMSHEIRTPINAILGMDEMILRETGEKDIKEYAEDIQSSGQTLLAIVNDILDFSKVEEGKMEIVPATYETARMINDLVNMTKERAAGKGLEFKVDYDRAIPRLLRGDEIRIKQCALNLLTNAVKYTDKGSISLNIGFAAIDDSKVSLDFIVEDTGAGIRAEDMEDLFSPFKRIDDVKNRSIEGTGLGISITKRLLDLMGSDLKVESEFGKGSKFSFSVVQTSMTVETIGEFERKDEAEKGSKQKYKELFHAPDANILVVDDIKMNITVITKLLKRTRMQIDTATSGPEAIKKAAQHDYDIIFIDHLMPEMDGIETLRHMKETEKEKEPVYIVLTANAIAGAREMYLNEGFADYVSKPVVGEHLERLIMSYLPPEKLLDTPDSV